jgi:hypothetical protein
MEVCLEPAKSGVGDVMLKKINYRPLYQYGVLTGVRRNAIVLETPGEAVQGFDNPAQLQKEVRDSAIPVRTGPIYQHIKDTEQMKQFIKDAGMDKQIDLRKGLEDMRGDVDTITKKGVTDETLYIQSDSRLLN